MGLRRNKRCAMAETLLNKEPKDMMPAPQIAIFSATDWIEANPIRVYGLWITGTSQNVTMGSHNRCKNFPERKRS